MLAVLKQKAALFALVAWCVALLAVRIRYSSSVGNAFLLWNLLLAVIPVLAACALQALDLHPGLTVPKVLAFVAWLAFLPNAPYLITDIVHLTQHPAVPQWFDVAMFASFAATGALLGYAAVADVHDVLAARVGSIFGWAVAIASLLASGFGIYLGRFLRWNSWDIVTAPSTLLRQVAYEISHLGVHDSTWQVSVVYGVGLVFGYVAMRSLRSSALPRPRLQANSLWVHYSNGVFLEVVPATQDGFGTGTYPTAAELTLRHEDGTRYLSFRRIAGRKTLVATAGGVVTQKTSSGIEMGGTGGEAVTWAENGYVYRIQPSPPIPASLALLVEVEKATR
jgi:uncharacterized membrane protein